MSTQALPLPLRPFQPFDEAPRKQSPKPRPRQSPEQGRALEVLGHAVEYLVDSRLFDQWQSPADAEAVHLLMSCSRAVFAGDGNVKPWHQRVQHGLLKRLHLQGNGAQ